MKPDIKEKWVAALRSEKYPKGKDCLKANGRYCCLGVLTDLYILENNLTWDRGDGPYGSFDGEETFLPEPVRIWAGLPSDQPMVVDKATGQGRSLHILNDGQSSYDDHPGERVHSFSEIADLIENGDFL